MTVKDLRTLVDNLDEYIRIPGGIDRLKKTILHLAVSGQLVPQDPSEGTGEELYQQIQTEKQKLIAEGKLKKQKPLPEITEDEIPFQIPRTWKWVRLGEVLHFINGDRGKNYPSKDKLHVTGDIPFLSAINLKDKMISTQKLFFLSDEQFEILGSGKVKLNDLIVCIRGSLGKHAKSNFNTGAIASSLVILRNNLTTEIFTDFSSTYLDTSLFEQEIAKYDNGTAQPNLSANNFKLFALPLPPLAEQERIVNKVESIFQLIDELAEKYQQEQLERVKLVKSSFSKLAKDQNHLALDLLTDIVKTKQDAAELRKTILHLAVSGQLAPQDPSEGTGEELYQQIQTEKQKLILEGKLKKQKPLPEITEDEIPFDIPDSWKWVRLGDATDTVMGQSPPGENVFTDPVGLPFYQGKTEFGKNNPTPRKWCKHPKKRARGGAVLISVRAPVGGTNITNLECGIGRGLAAIHALSSMPKELLRIALDTNKKYLESLSTGTTFAAINAGDLLGVPFALPPLQEQKRIVQKTTQLLDLVTQLESHLEYK